MLQSMGGLEGVQNMLGNMDPNTLQALMGGMGGMGGGLGGGLPGAGLGAFGGGLPGAGLGAFGGLGGASASSSSTPSSSVPQQDPKEKYAVQLQQMKDMGFLDEDTNLQVLQQ